MQQKEINFQSLLNISRHMTLDEFHSRYKNVKIIHKTRNSTVRLAIHIQTGQNVIVKSVYKNSIINSQLKIESILKEVNVLTFLRESKHVTQIYDVIYCLDSFHIVLEYAECGDLFNYINNHGKSLTEADVKHLFKPIAKTVAMIHRNNIAHRDLKLENILFDNTGRIMIADFGFATKFNRKSHKSSTNDGNPNDESDLCSSICGTVNYEPPEIIRGDKYDPMKADSWSVGVILYVLMFKYFPFFSPSITDTVQLILTSEVKYPDSMRSTFSGELCDILTSLLVKEPKERLYIEDVVNSHSNFFGYHPPSTAEIDHDDFNIFNTDALNSLFGMNSTAPIGNVSKQERIHNSALNTITRSKDEFENLSADEFISYQIIKRRYQLGQIRYMKARYKSIAPGDFVKIPPNDDSSPVVNTTTNTNSNLDLKRSVINGIETRINHRRRSDESSDDDDDIDTNLIDQDQEIIDSKDESNSIDTISNESYSIDSINSTDTNNDNQINLIEFYNTNNNAGNPSSSVVHGKSKKRSNKGYRNSLNTQLPAYTPSSSPSMEVINQKKPRQMSPSNSRRIVKVKSRANKTPSLSPSTQSLASPTSSNKAVPSFLISNSAPLSSQLPPPRSYSIQGGQNDDEIQVGEENNVVQFVDTEINKKSKKLSKDIKNSNTSSLSSLNALALRREKLKRPSTDLKKLPDLNPVDPLSSLPAIHIDLNNGLDGLDSRSILNTPVSDDGMNYDSQEEDLSKKPSILQPVHSRRRTVSNSQLARKSSSSSYGFQSNEDILNAHKADFSLEKLISVINEFINKFDEIHIICEEESGAYVKFGNDENNELLVMLAFTRTGNNSSSYSINKIRGSDENLEKFEKLIVSEIGF